jgi:hypothetical protein
LTSAISMRPLMKWTMAMRFFTPLARHGCAQTASE